MVRPFVVRNPCKKHRVYCIGLARTIYIYKRIIYSIFGREIIKYTVIYGVYIQFWPTLCIHRICIWFRSTLTIRLSWGLHSMMCVWPIWYLSLWIQLWLAETCQQPISKSTWLQVTPHCYHCNHSNDARAIVLRCHLCWSCSALTTCWWCACKRTEVSHAKAAQLWQHVDDVRASVLRCQMLGGSALSHSCPAESYTPIDAMSFKRNKVHAMRYRSFDAMRFKRNKVWMQWGTGRLMRWVLNATKYGWIEVQVVWCGEF